MATTKKIYVTKNKNYLLDTLQLEKKYTKLKKEVSALKSENAMLKEKLSKVQCILNEK